MLGKLTVPYDLSRKLSGQGVELLSVMAEHAEAIRDFLNSSGKARKACQAS